MEPGLTPAGRIIFSQSAEPRGDGGRAEADPDPLLVRLARSFSASQAEGLFLPMCEVSH